jgi:hypothetical protein
VFGRLERNLEEGAAAEAPHTAVEPRDAGTLGDRHNFTRNTLEPVRGKISPARRSPRKRSWASVGGLVSFNRTPALETAIGTRSRPVA